MRFILFKLTLLLSLITAINPVLAGAFQVGFSCEKHFEGAHRPVLSEAVDVLIETPRLLLVKAKDSPKSMVIGVYERQTGLLVGHIYYVKLSPKIGQLPLEFFDFARGRGYATEAKFALMSYAFKKDGLQLIKADIRFDNIASIVLHGKLGFEKYSNEKWFATGSSLSKVRKKISTQFQNDLVAFATPDSECSLARVCAHQYVQAAFEFDPSSAMDEMRTKRHIVNKENISEAEIKWIQKYIQLSPQLQEAVYDHLPNIYAIHLYMAVQKLFIGNLTSSGWENHRGDLVARLQQTFLLLDRIKN